MDTIRQAMKEAKWMIELCLKFTVTAMKKLGKNKSLLNHSPILRSPNILFPPSSSIPVSLAKMNVIHRPVCASNTGN